MADDIDLRSLAAARKAGGGAEETQTPEPEPFDPEVDTEVDLPEGDDLPASGGYDDEDEDGSRVADDQPGSAPASDPAAEAREELRQFRLEQVKEKRVGLHARAREVQGYKDNARNYISQAQAEIDQYRIQEAEHTGRQDWAAVAQTKRYIVEMEGNVRKAQSTLTQAEHEMNSLIERDASLFEQEGKLAPKPRANPAQARFMARNPWFDPNPNTTDPRSRKAHEWSADLAKEYRVDGDRLYENLEKRIARMDPRLKARSAGGNAAAARRTVSAAGSGAAAGKARVPKMLQEALAQGPGFDKAAVGRMVAHIQRAKAERGGNR